MTNSSKFSHPGSTSALCFLCHATVHVTVRRSGTRRETTRRCLQRLIFDQLLAISCSPSPLILIIGFCPGMIQICSMHAISLGLCFPTNAASLCTLLRIVFPSNDALNEAFADFTCWRKSMGVRSSQWRFKVDGVSVTRCRPKTQPGPLPYS